MQQSTVSFRKLAEKMDNFDSARQWTNLSPEDLAKSIILEGAELLEHFQWDVTLRNRKDTPLKKDQEEIEKEVADILIYLMKFCREMKIDIVKATMKKIEKLEKKYPVDYRKWWGHEEYIKIKKAYRQSK